MKIPEGPSIPESNLSNFKVTAKCIRCGVGNLTVTVRDEAEKPARNNALQTFIFGHGYGSPHIKLPQCTAGAGKSAVDYTIISIEEVPG